uniref:CRAL-TRIO domain-containing protein n=1 Tax=Strigamia maritima TaxID=126957 RepID=T1J2H6_STRMM
MTSLPNLSLMAKEEDNLVLAESSLRTKSPSSSSDISVTSFVNAQQRSTFISNTRLSEEELKRNLALLSVSCALSFGALSTCQALQSSLSPQPSLGVASFGGVYACAAISSLVGPSIVQVLGINTSLLIGSVSSVTFIASHLSPHLLTLTPSALVLGLFFLFFNFALNSGDVIAYLITCLILSPGGVEDTLLRLSPAPEGPRLPCGSGADCVLNLTNAAHLYAPHSPQHPASLTAHDSTWMWLITAMTAGSVAAAVLIGAGLKRMDVGEQQDPLERPPALIYLQQVCRTFLDSKFVFCLPLVFCAGFQHGLLMTDFTKFYVDCTLSISHVGWTILCSAVTQMCTAFIVPLLALHIPRMAILLAALSFQLGLLIVLWLWRPDADDVPVFYVIAGGWGICRAVWNTMTFPIIAISYVDVWQAPIAAYDFAHNAGLAIAFSIHRFICCHARLQRFHKLRSTTFQALPHEFAFTPPSFCSRARAAVLVLQAMRIAHKRFIFSSWQDVEKKEFSFTVRDVGWERKSERETKIGFGTVLTLIFKSAVADAITEGKDDDFYLRWLRARNYDPAKAEIMLRRSLTWRKQSHIDELVDTYKPPEVLRKYYPYGFAGHAIEGEPVIIVPFGNCDIKGLLHAVKKSEYIKYTIYILEKAIRDMDEQTIKLGKVVDRMVIIFDLEHFGMKHITWKPAMDALLYMVQMHEGNYPERLKKVYVVNTPKIFSVVYAIIRPMMSDVTADKVKIFGRDRWREAILNEIDANELPAHWGGTRTDENGDPRCPDIICLGGDVPQSYYMAPVSRLLESKNLETAVIAKGAMLQIEKVVEVGGSAIRWEFKTEEYDIAFAVYKKLEDSEMQEIIPKQRVNSHLVPEDGQLVCSEPGTCDLF